MTTLFPPLPVAKVVFADADHGVVVALLPVLGDVTVGEPLVAPGSRVLDVVPGGRRHMSVKFSNLTLRSSSFGTRTDRLYLLS